MRPSPTFTFSLSASKMVLYLCLGLLQVSGVYAAATSTTAATHQLPPRRGSHISTGFLKPALLVSTSAGANQCQRGQKNMSNASRNGGRAGQQTRRQEVRNSGRLTDSYGLMNGMFDNECMQRHMNVR
mmetsp:Transcript_15453/g.25769  ORF Transcript_15453/g.25769 Transcript_15453/m.25769 type:complete len:128 (-) Transcript_15453:112-495(-)